MARVVSRPPDRTAVKRVFVVVKMMAVGGGEGCASGESAHSTRVCASKRGTVLHVLSMIATRNPCRRAYANVRRAFALNPSCFRLPSVIARATPCRRADTNARPGLTG